MSGAVILSGFDEGLEILLEAEDAAQLDVSGKAYYALMRMAVAEERPAEVLALLARTRARGVEQTDGLLLGAMQAAASVEDWGAVARLDAELTWGPEEASMAAIELEAFAADPSVLDEMRAARGAPTSAVQAQPTLAEALALALKAHCKRGDVSLAVNVLERKRACGAALRLAEYAELAALAKRTSRPNVLLALRPSDVQRTLDATLEPRLFAVTNQIGLAGSALGRVERVLVAGLAGALAIGGALALTSSLAPSDPFGTSSVFASLGDATASDPLNF